MNKLINSLVTGLVFILIGAGLLADRFLSFRFGWEQAFPILLIALAISSFIRAFSGNRHSAFWGGFLGLLGAYFFLRNYEFVEAFWFFEYWPMFLLAFGCGFICSFLFYPADWGVLIPAAIFTGLGALFLLDSLHVFKNIWSTFWDLAESYWPIILILVGLGVIGGSLKSRSERAGH